MDAKIEKQIKSKINRLIKSAEKRLSRNCKLNDSQIRAIIIGVVSSTSNEFFNHDIESLEEFFEKIKFSDSVTINKIITNLRYFLNDVVKRFQIRQDEGTKRRKRKFMYGELTKYLEVEIKKEKWLADETVRSKKIEVVKRKFKAMGFITTSGSIRATLQRMGYAVMRDNKKS